MGPQQGHHLPDTFARDIAAFPRRVQTSLHGPLVLCISPSNRRLSMRIRTAGVIAVAALALVASGCSSGDKAKTSTSQKPAGGTLVIWADDQRAAALKPFADTFGKENGVTVQVQAVSKDLQ